MLPKRLIERYLKSLLPQIGRYIAARNRPKQMTLLVCRRSYDRLCSFHRRSLASAAVKSAT